MKRQVCAAIIALTSSISLYAQEGRLSLGSTKDQKGFWEIRPGLGGAPRPADVPFQPWARALYDYRQSRTDLYPPLVRCKPSGGPGFFNAPGFEIVEAPEQQRVFILNIAGPHSWRVIYTDGRPHPPNPRPTYLGHSVGRWEGNTLVIDTVGFNGFAELDSRGQPTSPALHTVERLTPAADGSGIDIEVTITDPEYYDESFTIKRAWNRSSVTHPLEYDCSENPRAEDFENAYYVRDRYRPTCMRVKGEGAALSRIVCRRPE